MNVTTEPATCPPGRSGATSIRPESLNHLHARGPRHRRARADFADRHGKFCIHLQGRVFHPCGCGEPDRACCSRADGSDCRTRGAGQRLSWRKCSGRSGRFRKLPLRWSPAEDECVLRVREDPRWPGAARCQGRPSVPPRQPNPGWSCSAVGARTSRPLQPGALLRRADTPRMRSYPRASPTPYR